MPVAEMDTRNAARAETNTTRLARRDIAMAKPDLIAQSR